MTRLENHQSDARLHAAAIARDIMGVFQETAAKKKAA
jgi:hypothetical protein